VLFNVDVCNHVNNIGDEKERFGGDNEEDYCSAVTTSSYGICNDEKELFRRP
jgi:hypothetical protein